jgi:hypothetical protein
MPRSFAMVMLDSKSGILRMARSCPSLSGGTMKVPLPLSSIKAAPLIVLSSISATSTLKPSPIVDEEVGACHTDRA